MSEAVVVNWLAGRTRYGDGGARSPPVEVPHGERGVGPAGPACVTNAKVLRVIPSGASNSVSSHVS